MQFLHRTPPDAPSMALKILPFPFVAHPLLSPGPAGVIKMLERRTRCNGGMT